MAVAQEGRLMSDRRPLASGDVLAHRYELQDLVTKTHAFAFIDHL